MPCLTHVLTRHPVAVDASGSAARTRPADSSSRSAREDRAALALVCRRALLIQPFDVVLQLTGRRLGHALTFCAARVLEQSQIAQDRSESWRAIPGAAAPSAAGTTSSRSPIAAIAAFTGIGFDSTKLIEHQRHQARRESPCAAAKSPRSAASTICDHLARAPRSTRRRSRRALPPPSAAA